MFSSSCELSNLAGQRRYRDFHRDHLRIYDFWRSVIAATASRFAAMRMWLYRSSIARLIWPMRASMVDSGTPASARRVQNVCRKSCSRQETPAAARTMSQPEVMSVTGLSGDVGCGEPKGKTQ